MAEDQGEIAPVPERVFEAVCQILEDVVLVVAGHTVQDDDVASDRLVGKWLPAALKPGQEQAVADDGIGQDDPFQMEKQCREREVAAVSSVASLAASACSGASTIKVAPCRVSGRVV